MTVFFEDHKRKEIFENKFSDFEALYEMASCFSLRSARSNFEVSEEKV